MPRRVDRQVTYDTLKQSASPFGLAVIEQAERLNMPMSAFRRRVWHHYGKFYAFLTPMKYIRADHLPDILKIARSFDMDAVELIRLFYGLEDKEMAALMGLFAVYLQLKDPEAQQLFFRLAMVFSVDDGDGEEKRTTETVKDKLDSMQL